MRNPLGCPSNPQTRTNCNLGCTATGKKYNKLAPQPVPQTPWICHFHFSVLRKRNPPGNRLWPPPPCLAVFHVIIFTIWNETYQAKCSSSIPSVPPLHLALSGGQTLRLSNKKVEYATNAYRSLKNVCKGLAWQNSFGIYLKVCNSSKEANCVERKLSRILSTQIQCLLLLLILLL